MWDVYEISFYWKEWTLYWNEFPLFVKWKKSFVVVPTSNNEIDYSGFEYWNFFRDFLNLLVPKKN